MRNLSLPCGPPPQRDRLFASNGSSPASAAPPATTPANQPPQRRTHNPYDAAFLEWSVYGSRYTRDVVCRPAPPASSQSAAAAITPTPSHASAPVRVTPLAVTPPDASAMVPNPLRQQPQGVSVSDRNLRGINPMTHDPVQMTQTLQMIPHSVTGLLSQGARLVEASLLPTRPLDSPNPPRTDGARTTSRWSRPNPAAAPLHRRLVSVTNIYYGAFDGDLWKVAEFLNGLVNMVVCPSASPTSPFFIRFSPQSSSRAPSSDSHIFPFQVEVYAREPSTASTASARNSVLEGAMNVASVNDPKLFTDHVLNYYGRHVRVIFDHRDVLWIHDSGMFGDNGSLRVIDQYMNSLRGIVDHKTRHARMQGLPPATMGIKKYYPPQGGLVDPT